MYTMELSQTFILNRPSPMREPRQYKKKSFINNIKKDCIILGESSPNYSFVESYYCEICKKIVIDVN
jgi:hypothetical protein